MSLLPNNQIKLYGLGNSLTELINLYKNKNFPNKIFLSGQKGIGKCTLAYHLTNYILSVNEEFSYDEKNFFINKENRSYKLIQNGSNINFLLIDLLAEKKSINISQIRNLILNLTKSSFNSKPRIVLIDNIEYLNINSINALLKIIEEPNDGIYFILINNNKKILETLKSRCLNFKMSLSHSSSLQVINDLLEENVYNIINKDLLSYYFTPGQTYNLIKSASKNNIELSKLNLRQIILLIIDNSIYKKEPLIKFFLFEFIELYFSINLSLKDVFFYNNFLKKISDVRRFNLDEDSLFLEFKSKVLNG
tara:strand:+ start:1189 stop:2109 length:921 start_codon:yes stop_codon:yes gene_type:complete